MDVLSRGLVKRVRRSGVFLGSACVMRVRRGSMIMLMCLLGLGRPWLMTHARSRTPRQRSKTSEKRGRAAVVKCSTRRPGASRDGSQSRLELFLARLFLV